MRAFAFATGERYASLALNLVTTAVLSRLLSPGEFGIAVIGFAAASVASGLVEFGASNYLVQTEELDNAAVHTVFTMAFVMAVPFAVALYLTAPFIAGFYHLPALDSFLRVFAIGLALLPLSAPASALLTRNLAFGRKGAATVAVSIVNAAVSITLAARGFSHVSFAWAYVASNAAAALLYPLALRSLRTVGFSLRRWRAVLTFGVFGGASRLLGVATENLAYLIMGRFISPAGIGLLYRAGMLITFPDRVLLGAASSVALPAFSERVRRGEPVGAAYVRTAELLAAVHWPAIAVIGLLAHPIVRVFLGGQWGEVASFVQIMVGAAVFNAAMSLNAPAQIAAGAVKSTPFLALFQAVVSAVCIAVAAPHGAKAIAWSLWVAMPINAAASVWLVQRVAPFPLKQLLAAALRSALIAAGAALGPACILLLEGTADIGLLSTAAALVLAAAGWLAALMLSRHPLLQQGREALLRVQAKLSSR